MIKATGDLLSELENNNRSLNSYLDDASDSFLYPDIKAFWLDLIEKSNRSKSDIINKSDINYSYFYDVICGNKIPSRDKVIRLCLAMKSGIDNCQAALRLSGKSQLYPRIRRDSIILYALKNEWSVFKCSTVLAEYSEDELK